MWEALRNGETFTLNKSGQIQRFEPGHYAMDDLYGSSFSHKHNLSISGADEKFSYRASLGYAENNSQLKVADDGEKRYSARLNMDYQASKLLKLESGMSYESRILRLHLPMSGQDIMISGYGLITMRKDSFMILLEIVMSLADWLVAAK